jgi:hypothetical protein
LTQKQTGVRWHCAEGYQTVDDKLCHAQALLRYDFVAYEVRPVVGYDDVFTIKDEITQRGDAVCVSPLLGLP